MAEAWLKEHNKRIADGAFHQRRILDTTVHRYAADMRAGKWALNGEAILFDEDGNLIDGQHRLWAVMKAGIPVHMMITTGVPVVSGQSGDVKAMHTINTGRNRTFGMQLRIEGVAYATQISASIRAAAIMATYHTMVKPPQLSTSQGWAIQDIIGDHIREVLKTLSKQSQSNKNSRGFLVGPLAVMRAKYQDEVDLFADEYQSMEGMTKGSPVLTLHRFIERPTSRQGSDFIRGCVGGVCSCFQAYVEERKIEPIRGGSEKAVEWACNEARGVIRKIRDIIGPPMPTKVEELHE